MHAPAPPPESRTGTGDHFPRLIPVGERGHAIMNGRSRTIPGAFAIASCVITPPLFRPWASWNRRFSQKQLFTPTCIRPIPVALQQKIDTYKICRKNGIFGLSTKRARKSAAQWAKWHHSEVSEDTIVAGIMSGMPSVPRNCWAPVCIRGTVGWVRAVWKRPSEESCRINRAGF